MTQIVLFSKKDFISLNGIFNPKRAGLFGPISQPGGGGPKISETDLTKHQAFGTSG